MADWLDKYLRQDPGPRPANSRRPRQPYVRKKYPMSETTRQRLIAQRYEKYGITEARYEEMLANQGGGCAICGKAPTGRRLVIDHDHDTGKVRALLCSTCNLTLGKSVEPEWFRKAAAYLEAHKVKAA